ncbi:unnamed protein product [Prunus brigantina]
MDWDPSFWAYMATLPVVQAEVSNLIMGVHRLWNRLVLLDLNWCRASWPDWGLTFLDGKGFSPLSSLDLFMPCHPSYFNLTILSKLPVDLPLHHGCHVIESILASLCCDHLSEHRFLYLVHPPGAGPGSSASGTAVG